MFTQKFDDPSLTVSVCCPAVVSGTSTVVLKDPASFIVAVPKAVVPSQKKEAMPGLKYSPATVTD